MLSHILYDIPVLPIILISLALGISVFAAIVLVETIALRLLKWAGFWRALLHAFIINIASSIFGVIINVLIESIWSVLIALVLSIIIEGAALALIRRENSREVWRAAIIANIASYILIIYPVSLLFLL